MEQLRITSDKLSYFEDDKELAYCHFTEDDTSLTIDKTFVDSILRGKGIASKLMEEMKKLAKEKNKELKATCSYAVHYLSK